LDQNNTVRSVLAERRIEVGQ